MGTEALGEAFFRTRPDADFRRRDAFVMIAQIESLAPKPGAGGEGASGLDPRVWGGGTGDFTWGHVQRYFASCPWARHDQMPMHFYSEYLGLARYDDYVVYAGEAVTNRSWFLQLACARGVLPPQYADAVLVVVQENYGLEAVEARLWELLADRVLTPLLRVYDLGWRQRLKFYEHEARPEGLESPLWPFRFRSPAYLDAHKLRVYLDKYGKGKEGRR